MGLTRSVEAVDENGREMLTYGTADFPIAFFDDDLTEVAVPAHWHDELELVLITEGTVHMRIAGDSFDMRAGEGYFSNSGILHAANLETAAGRQHAMVFSPRIVSQAEDLIWKQYVEPVLGNPALPYVRLSPAVAWQAEALRLAETAWDAGAYDQAEYPLRVRHCLSRLLSLIGSNAEAAEGETRATGQYQRDERRVKKALLFIDGNYAEGIGIEDIARSAEISVSTCLRLFRSVLGTTPVQYLLAYRLQRAAEELRRSDGRTVAEIAYSCGFSDASYFNRCFRKAFSMTPSEYRR